jgi:hypothetical protein
VRTNALKNLRVSSLKAPRKQRTSKPILEIMNVRLACTLLSEKVPWRARNVSGMFHRSTG